MKVAFPVQPAPYFPFYAKDWLAETAGFDAELTGTYIALLAFAWTQQPPCTVPLDQAQLARVSGLGRRWAKVGRALLEERFELVDGRWRSRYLYPLYVEMQASRARRSAAGKLGNEARWGGSQSDRNGSDPSASTERSRSDRNAIANGSPALASASPEPLRGGALSGGSPPGGRETEDSALRSQSDRIATVHGQPGEASQRAADEESQLYAVYGEKLDEHVSAWESEPENATAAAEILTLVTTRMSGVKGSAETLGKALRGAYLDEARRRLELPDFPTWRAKELKRRQRIEKVPTGGTS